MLIKKYSGFINVYLKIYLFVYNKYSDISHSNLEELRCTLVRKSKYAANLVLRLT